MPREGSEGRKEGKTHRQYVCVCVCEAKEGVRCVKRKGSDQRGDETLEEAGGRRGRVGGTVKDHKAPVHVATLLFLWAFFFPSVFIFIFFHFHDATPPLPHYHNPPPLSPPPTPPQPIWQLHTSTHTLTVNSASARQKEAQP